MIHLALAGYSSTAVQRGIISHGHNCHLLVLDLLLDVVDGVAGLDIKGDGLTREGFHEDLHGGRGSTSETKQNLTPRMRAPLRLLLIFLFAPLIAVLQVQLSKAMQQLIEELRSRAQVYWKLGADALQQHSRALSITSAVAGTAFVLWVLLYATVMYLQEVKSMGKVTVLKVSTRAFVQARREHMAFTSRLRRVPESAAQHDDCTEQYTISHRL
jgi:hypothetical protein